MRKEKTRTWRSGKEKVTKEEESGERVMQVGVDFVCREIFRQQVDNHMGM